LQKANLAGPTGVPLFVFNDEPFFGQDRLDQLDYRASRLLVLQKDKPPYQFVLGPEAK
jgi:hypothetical protein